VHVHLIGGADKAAELDAKRAIKQGTELALRMDTSEPGTRRCTGCTRRKPPGPGRRAGQPEKPGTPWWPRAT
jgi:hypothetical protein